ncbi:MAG: tRNA (N(6)-L-threonylcarbamoyladenosine(37)-C(2))-methylthiotransferase [Candidatus Nanoarchaeia archaeon]|nr:tRNA (N(6)-L-threonylcarbamoyladenosine(37)-C(2))-methylthiotransferase [Candidatus Nanoarchaeia archaeon]MDD5588075.1 tRNA (N(6)-L-threonylcarbamoyladenosine(37)-C(2))-methylthiotransferase [Candidatus Nanoarchaeia archaeon]
MKKIFIKTYGCQSNIADSEQLAGILSKKYKIVDSLEKADIIILNSCAVKLRTLNKQLDFIKNIPKNKKIFIGGCLPKIVNLRKTYPNISGFFDTNTILKVPELILEDYIIISNEKEHRINLPRVRKTKDLAIINICQGCEGNCGYCAAKLSRGELKSYKIEDILKEFKQALKEKCTKFYLTGQDTGCYGFDLKTNLPSLLKEILKIKGDYKIRIGMMNPNNILNFLDELIKIYKNEHIVKFLHIPIQSGSDKVLKEMNRFYKVKDFELIVKKFRKEIPEIKISTDIICGYPTETEQDFKKTLDLIEKVKPDVLNISKFSSMHNTRASKLKQLSSEIIKDRSVRLTKLFKSLKK